MKNEKTLKSQRTVNPRRGRRYFSEEVRKTIVQEIEAGLSKAEAGRKYKVSLTSLIPMDATLIYSNEDDSRA